VKPIKLKSLDEILSRFKELVHRYRRRFLKRNLQPCPNNCKYADVVGRKVIGCGRCGSKNPEFCKRQEQFVPLFNKEELAEQFKRSLRDPRVLLSDYRDLVILSWLLGQYDANESEVIPEQFIRKVESHDK
jgi:hypothetical protein